MANTKKSVTNTKKSSTKTTAKKPPAIKKTTKTSITKRPIKTEDNKAEVEESKVESKVGDTIAKNNKAKQKATKEILYNQEQLREEKKQTAILLLNKIEALRNRYTEEQLSTQQILQYVASIYHIDIKYNKVSEELREDDGNKV